MLNFQVSLNNYLLILNHFSSLFDFKSLLTILYSVSMVGGILVYIVHMSSAWNQAAKKLGKAVLTGGAFGAGENITDKIIDKVFGESKPAPDSSTTPAADTSGTSGTSSNENKGSSAPTPAVDTSSTGSQTSSSAGAPDTKS